MTNLRKFSDDEALKPYWGCVEARAERIQRCEQRLTEGQRRLMEFASAHEYYGLHKVDGGWFLREWAPNATEIIVTGDFCNWVTSDHFKMSRISDSGDWEIFLPNDVLKHGQFYHLIMRWNGGEGTRIPAYARRVVQDDATKLFSAQVWESEPYAWKFPKPTKKVKNPLIYESHVGMAQEDYKVGSYNEFRERILPRVVKSGYNTLQLMAVMEHPYYGSFGYHVANFFAASSRFGTPEELKMLIDAAHEAGLSVIIDLVHSHCVKNELEGLSKFDGTTTQYFHAGDRGYHEAWDSCCFDYGKIEVLHFLLSNCRYWLDEFKIDGFRFDGVTSMLYFDHGLGRDFSNYDSYFHGGIDFDAETYLALANKVIHQVNPEAMTIAEDMSGMPGLGVKVEEGGLGFDFKLAMGTPDFWYKTLEMRDEDWNVDHMWYELTNRRNDEKSVTYAECHDQAIVGSKTIAFELMDAEMYTSMDRNSTSMVVERGIALHKMIRLITLVTGGDGYLNFMGNEFGHPEWIDFPREGNGWSYHYSRRQWSLVDNGFLCYEFLNNFDREMINVVDSVNLLESEPSKVFSHCDDQILVIERDGYVFAFNFSPDHSFSDYLINGLRGSYELAMDSDAGHFGGQERVKANQTFFSADYENGHGIKVYLPSRTVLILRKM